MSKKNVKSVAVQAPKHETPAVQLNGERRVSAAGRELGVRYSFLSKPVHVLKAELRAQGLKGNDVKRLINAALSDGKNAAWLMYDAFGSVARSKGMVPSYCDMNKMGTAATVKLVAPATIKEKGAVTPPEITAETIAAMSPEQRQATLDLLLGIAPSK